MAHCHGNLLLAFRWKVPSSRVADAAERAGGDVARMIGDNDTRASREFEDGMRTLAGPFGPSFTPQPIAHFASRHVKTSTYTTLHNSLPSDNQIVYVCANPSFLE